MSKVKNSTLKLFISFQPFREAMSHPYITLRSRLWACKASNVSMALVGMRRRKGHNGICDIKQSMLLVQLPRRM